MQQSFLPWSLAPLDIVISLDHTDGVTAPGLDHVINSVHCVCLWVIFQYVITIVTIVITIPAT